MNFVINPSFLPLKTCAIKKNFFIWQNNVKLLAYERLLMFFIS